MGALAPPVEPPKYKAIDYALWGRVAGVVQNANGHDLDDLSANGVFEFHVHGQVHQYIKYTADFIAGFNSGDSALADADGTPINPRIAGTASLLDGIIQFEPIDEFNLWVGRMLVPVDRSNFSGPWFMAPWNYPGFLPNGGIYAPAEGPNGRNDGATVWGQVGGGLFKYYVGAFDLYDVTQSPLYSGRLNVALLNPEPGFYNSSTYYGKDILAIGVGAQFKKNGSVGPVAVAPPPPPPPPTDDYAEFNADVLFEKDLGAGGVLDVEGDFNHFWGDFQAVRNGWFALASYLTPEPLGVGKLQPLVRVQQAIFAAGGPGPSTMIDAQVGYVIDAYSARLALGYTHAYTDGGDGPEFNSLFLGVQIEK